MSDPARITLVRGGEQALIDRAVASTVAAIRTRVPAADRVEVDASVEEAANDLRYACAPTLFGEDIIVLIGSLQSADESFMAALQEVIADQPDNVWLIAHPDGTAGGKKLLEVLRGARADEIECLAVKKGKRTIEIISKEFTRQRRRATSDAVTALYEAVGHDLPMLFAAVGQLVADVPDDPITHEHVRAYFVGVADVAGWQIAESVWDRLPAQALESVRHAAATGNESSVGVMSVLAMTSGLRDIIRVGGMGPGASEADVARELGLPPWRVGPLKRQWSRWSADQRRLAASLVELADAEALMKGGLERGHSLEVEQKLHLLERLVTNTAAQQAKGA
jgi:DNA polymerase-3 subunit delta